MMTKTKWINYIKGFLMILVVLGHAITGSARHSSALLEDIYNYIYLFHMPLFFMLAGYLFELNSEKYIKQGTGVFIRNKFLALIIPYISYSFVTYLCIWILNFLPQVNAILGDAYQIGSLKECVIQILFWQDSLDQHLWFVYALFFEFLINIVFISCVKKNPKRDWLLLLVAVVLHCITLKCPIMIVQRIFNYLVYFVAGRIIFQQRTLEKMQKRTFFVCCTALILSIAKMMILKILFDNYLLTVMKALFSICVSGCMGIALCLLFIKFENSKPNMLFNSIYQYNFEIYLLHQPFIVSGFTLVFLHVTHISPFIIVTASTVIGLVSSVILAKVMGANSIIRKLIFGKWR